MEDVEEELRLRLREACKGYIGEQLTPDMISKVKTKCVSIAHAFLNELDIKCLAVDCYDAGDGCVGIRVYDPDL